MHSYTHRSTADFVFDPHRVYNQKNTPSSWKPTGLWISVDYSWQHWLASEGYLDDSSWGSVDYTVDIDAKECLWIRNHDQFISFHNNYIVRNSSVHNVTNEYSILSEIDWEPLSKNWPGIFIAPYLYEFRLKKPYTDWYYTWDVASGCVWDLSIIRGVW